MSANNANISGYILAGGKSSRMGADKGLLLLDSKPMVQHIAEAMRHWVQSITLITTNPKYTALGYLLVADDVPEKGPLSGIATALRHSETENNLILSCDTPQLSSEAIHRFLENCTDVAINIATVGSQWHPLLGVYKKAVLPRFAEFVAEDKLALHSAIKQLDYHLVPMDAHADAFENINTKADFEQLKMKYHAR